MYNNNMLKLFSLLLILFINSNFVVADTNEVLFSYIVPYGVCGDLYCDPFESCGSCPQDCGSCQVGTGGGGSIIIQDQINTSTNTTIIPSTIWWDKEYNVGEVTTTNGTMVLGGFFVLSLVGLIFYAPSIKEVRSFGNEVLVTAEKTERIVVDRMSDEIVDTMKVDFTADETINGFIVDYEDKNKKKKRR